MLQRGHYVKKYWTKKKKKLILQKYSCATFYQNSVWGLSFDIKINLFKRKTSVVKINPTVHAVIWRIFNCFSDWKVQKPSLKGQCHEIFCFWFFSWISFPPAPENSIKTISNFLENSRRYSQLKVCHQCQRHRWQMEKIFSQKNFNNFVWSPLDCRGNIYINFCLQVHFQVSAAWYCSHYLPPVSLINLPPVSLTPWQTCHRCQQHKGNWWQKFAAGFVDIGGKFATGVVDTSGAPCLANISANFRKNSKGS